MGIKAAISKPYARYITGKVNKLSRTAVAAQENTFRELIKSGCKTMFGKDHGFEKIRTYADFKKQVPIRDYEGLRNYIDQVVAGKPDILWPGKPIYLSKTSGTTSGVKYIPISKASMPGHLRSARNALLAYIAETGKRDFVNGKMIFLQGNPELEEKNGIKVGRLSGIVAHHVPGYLQKNRLPSWETNCIDDWETKIAAIVEETVKENMTLISGIPSWVQMYFELLIEECGGKPIKDIFPDFSLFVYGGVNYEPYRGRFEQMIGKRVDSIETYPASEGFIAYQDSQKEKGLLLTLNTGIFYEFIPAAEVFNENPTRLSLKEVETGVNYAIILNTNAGLWGYNIGDTVKFVSTDPYRLVVTGRIKHFISAFGEHVIGEEVEAAMQEMAKLSNAAIVEFHVAPQVAPPAGELPYHEWFIEFSREPEDMEAFRLGLDKNMVERNIYYKDLISGKILQPLKITRVKKGGFNACMKSMGKLGGQNKVPRLSDNREFAEGLEKYC